MRIIYDEKINIKVNVNTLLPLKSKFYIESEEIIYTRDLSYIEQLGARTFNLDCSDDLGCIVDIILKDYQLVECYFLLGVELNNISMSLTFHEEDIVGNQISKILKNNTFSNDIVLDYCNKTNSSELVELAEREIFFNSSKSHNFFDCDFRELLSKESFIGCGSSRAVFRIDEEYVIKVNLHMIGEIQSYSEALIYNHSDFEEYRDMLCKPLYACKEYSIYEYCTPLSELDCYHIDVYYCDVFKQEVLNRFDKLLYVLDQHKIVQSDCYDCSSIGIKDGQLKLLDFGGTFDVLEKLHSKYAPCINAYWEAHHFSVDCDMTQDNVKAEYRELIYNFLNECGFDLN